MAATTTPRFDTVTPRVPVPDIDHAGICRDSVSLDLIVVPAARQGTAMAYVRLSGVDAYHAELRGRNVAASEIGDRDYVLRDFEVIDPSGNRLAFGEPLEDEHGLLV